jgi:sodium-coupled neutral amino acid transporter 11
MNPLIFFQATPSALDKCGFMFGMVVVFCLGILFYFTIMTLVKSANLVRASNLQELVNVCYGRVGEVGLNIVLFVTAWYAILSLQRRTSMAGYTVILGDVLPDVLHHAIGGDDGRGNLSPFVNWLISRRAQVLLVSWLVLFPVSLARSLSALAKYSIIALSGITVIVASILATAPGLRGTDFAGTGGVTGIRLSGIPGAVSILSFAFVCHHNSISSLQS